MLHFVCDYLSHSVVISTHSDSLLGSDKPCRGDFIYFGHTTCASFDSWWICVIAKCAAHPTGALLVIGLYSQVCCCIGKLLVLFSARVVPSFISDRAYVRSSPDLFSRFTGSASIIRCIFCCTRQITTHFLHALHLLSLSKAGAIQLPVGASQGLGIAGSA